MIRRFSSALDLFLYNLLYLLKHFSQDFSKILVVLGLQNSRRGTPIRLMAKLIGLRRLPRANVTVPFNSQVGVGRNFVQHLFLGGEGVAREARGALAQIARCRA